MENFLEKPADPPGLPDNPDISLVSMGVYIFNAGILVEEVIKDAKNKTSKHDFGGDIIPQMVGRKKVFAYNFQDPASGTPQLLAGYRAVGRLFQGPPGPAGPRAHFELFDADWPLRSRPQLFPPSKFITSGEPRGRGGLPHRLGLHHRRHGGPVGPLPRGRCGSRRHGGAKTPSSGTGWTSAPGPSQAGHHRRRGAGARRASHRLDPAVGRQPLPRHRKRHCGGAQQRRHGRGLRPCLPWPRPPRVL